MAYTADEVAGLFEGNGSVLDTICMNGSEDEIGMEEVEVVENPSWHHTPEFDEFEELQGMPMLS